LTKLIVAYFYMMEKRVAISKVTPCKSEIQSPAKGNNPWVNVLAHCGSRILQPVLLIELHKEFIRDIPTSVRGEKKPLYMMKEIMPIEEVIHTKARQYNGN